MDINQENWGLDTLLCHFGEEEKVKGAVVAPIFQNSLFTFETMEELLTNMGQNPGGPPYHYSRVGNPTVELAERKLAALEGTEGARLFGCGMAAISAAILSTVEQGSHVVTMDSAYGPTKTFLGSYLKRFGVEVTFVDGRCTEELLDAVRPETSLIYLESPSSMLFRVQDVPTIAQHAKSKGIATAIDNTYNSPLYMNPAAMGVDLVIHSATKYIGGHSDVTAGVVCGSSERMDRLTRQELMFIGSVLHPFQAWLLLRGLRTLSLRIPRHESTANTVAAWLDDQDAIREVHHLGLLTYPQRDLVKKMMRGTTGLFSFEPKQQDPAKIKAFCDALKVFQRGISWGGFESLVVALPLKPADFETTKWVIRLFTGLEDPKDLIADLAQALPILES
ncbi:MAG: trans-sulfuration enzyme family protein [Fimbriimonas sp.]